MGLTTGASKPSSRLATLALLLLAASLAAGSMASAQSNGDRLLGFSAAGTEAQRALERQLLGQPAGERMREYHTAMTSEPHHAGTAAQERTAEYYAERLREFGFFPTLHIAR